MKLNFPWESGYVHYIDYMNNIFKNREKFVPQNGKWFKAYFSQFRIGGL